MSCYFRHMKDILEEAKITVTPTNRNQMDQAFHKIVGTTYKDCPATWKEIKKSFLTDQKKREDLIRKLRDAIE